jgi:hypothetical protein
MMKLLRLSVLALTPLAAGAADLTGIWVGQMPTRNGETQDIAFQFRQTGGRLEGKLYGDYQSSSIVQGTVAGSAVTFVVSGSEQAGNQINETRTRFTGRFEKGELELMRERESSHNAGNNGTPEERRNAASRPTIRLKRLI